MAESLAGLPRDSADHTGQKKAIATPNQQINLEVLMLLYSSHMNSNTKNKFRSVSSGDQSPRVGLTNQIGRHGPPGVDACIFIKGLA